MIHPQKMELSEYLFFFCLFQGHGGWGGYGGSQARGLIGAVAVGLCHSHSNAGSEPDQSRICDLHHTSRQRWILNPLSKATEGTRVLIVPNWIR